MISKIKTFIGFLILFSQSVAFAKYFFEPHAAFILSGSSNIANAPTYSGPTYGAKLGFYQKSFGFNWGLDYSHASYTYSSGVVSSPSYSRNDTGIFLGFNSANQYRLWSQISYTKESILSDYVSGRTLEFGFGYAISEKISLNALYRLPSYTNSYSNGAKTTLSPTIEYHELSAGISFPLEL